MILKYLFMFSLFSFIGWILEFFYRGIRSKKALNPGFMNGCILPLYGIGAVLCDIICNLFKNFDSKYNLVWMFLISIVMLSLLEFITGFILDKFFHLKLWDYSKYIFNIKGYICAQYSIIWGILFLVYYIFIYKYMINIGDVFMNNNTGIFLLGIFYGIFLIDLSVSIGLMSNLIKYSKIIAESINLEKLRFELKDQIKRKKIIYSLFPYITTNNYLKDKIKDK